jgi:hypothetical protein
MDGYTERLMPHYCSLKQAKELAERGVDARLAKYNWYVGQPKKAAKARGEEERIILSDTTLAYNYKTHEKPVYYGAFSTSELGIMLPWGYASFFDKVFQGPDGIEMVQGVWRIADLTRYANRLAALNGEPCFSGESLTYTYIVGETEADVRAKFLIYLLNKGKLTSDTVNFKLKALN